MKVKLFALIFILSAAAGCSEPGKPVHEHAPAVVTNNGGSGTEISPTTQPTPGVKAFEATAQTSKDPIGEVLVPLGKKVLALDRVGDQASRIDRGVMDELEAFNLLFMKYYAQSPGDARLSRLLADYATALEYRCDQLASGCEGIRYFKIAGSSSAVAKLVIKTQPASRHYRFTYIALALSNRTGDSELATLLLSHSADLKSQVEEQFFRAAVSQLETALGLVLQRNQSKEEISRFLTEIRVWALLDNRQVQFSAPAREAAFDLIARAGYMYDSSGRLTAEFQAVINTQADSGEGLYHIQKGLQAVTAFHPEAVGAVFETQKDEIFFVLDAVTTGRISERAGSNLLLGSKASLQTITSRMQNYARLVFSEAVLDASARAAKIFKAPIPIGERLDVSIRQSSNIKTVWGELATVLRPLETLAELQISQRGFAGGSAEEVALKGIFRGLAKSVNMTATYTHTLALYYLLEKAGFWVNVGSADGQYSRRVDGGILATDLMNGDTLFLLRYSDDRTVLAPFEILHGLDMALRLGVFDVMGIDTDDFIATFMASVAEAQIHQIESFTTNIRERFSSQTGGLFTQACAEFQEAGARKVPRRIPFWDAKTSPYYGSLLSSTAITMTNSSLQYSPDSKRNYFASVASAMFYPEYQYAESLEKTRTELSDVLRWGEIMLKSYQAYLKDNVHLGGAEIQRRTVKAEAQTKKLAAKRREIVRRGVELFNTYGRCYYAMEKRDSEVKLKLIQATMAYLRQAHRDMMNLRRSPHPGISELQQIVARHSFQGLPSDYRGGTQISGDAYIVNMVDMYIRFGRFMQEGIKTETETIPPVAPNIIYDLGLKMDRDVTFMREGRLRPVYFNENESTFVADALRAMMDTGQINWFEPSGRLVSIENWRVLLESMITLYRLDRLVNGDAASMSPKDILDVHQLAADIFKRSPAKRELFNLLGHEYEYKYSASGADGLFFAMTRGTEIAGMDRAMGIFDTPGLMMNLEVLGYDYDAPFWSLEPGNHPEIIPRNSYTKVARAYYTARAASSRSPTILPYSRAIDAAMDKMMRQWIGTEVKAVTDYHSASIAYLNEVVKLAPEARPRVDFNNAISITSPLLSDHVINDYNKKLTDFNAATGGCFLQPDCRDFQ